MQYDITEKQRYRVIRTWHDLEKVDQEFYSITDARLKFTKGRLVQEINNNGSFEFTMPYGHTYFKDVIPMVDEFMVTDEVTNQVLFIGRPISAVMTDFKYTTVYCEGAMGYLHDILIRPEVWESTTPSGFFSDIIARYNAIKTPRIPHQKIEVGVCDIDSVTRYRYANYEKAYSVLESGCLESDGGYMMMEYGRDGTKTLHWTKEPRQYASGAQSIKYGTNIISFEEGLDLNDTATFVIALGDDTEEDLPGNLGKKRYSLDPVGLGIKVAGPEDPSGYDWIVKKYGYVEEVMDYEAASQSALETELQNDKGLYNHWPERQVTIDCDVADLHYINNGIFKFYLGQKVNLDVPYKVYSALSDLLYVTRIEWDLESAAPHIMVGELPKRTLSDRFKKNTDADTSDLEKKIKNQDARISRLESEGSGSSSSGGVTEGLYIYLGEAETTDPFVGDDVIYNDLGEENASDGDNP